MLQAFKALSSFAAHRQVEILAEPILLRSLRDALMHTSAAVRHGAVYCIWNLSRNASSFRELREAELDAALRGFIHSRLTSAAPIPAPGSPFLTLTIPPPPDAEIRDAKQKAREALKMIEAATR